MVSDDDLIERLESLQNSIDGLREDTKQRIRSSRQAIFAVALIALLGIVVGGIGIRHGIDADNSRKQRTVAACQQANDQTSREVTAQEKTSDAFIDYLAGLNPTPPPGLAEIVKDAKAKQHKVIEQYHPLRDCTPEGLAKFYAPKGR